MSRRQSPSDTGVGTLDFPRSRFAHSESNAAVPSAPFSLLPFLSPFLVSVTGGLRMEGAPSPVAGPRSPRSPDAAASPFLLPGLKLISLCLTSLHSFGAAFLMMGIPVGPVPVQPTAGMGLLTQTPQALIQVRRGLCCWQVWAGHPACFPKPRVSSPNIAGSHGAAVGECQSRLGEMYPVSVTSPIQACCIYAVIFQLVSRKCLYMELPTADSRELLVLFIITVIVLMRRVAGPAVTSCSWPVGQIHHGAGADQLGT